MTRVLLVDGPLEGSTIIVMSSPPEPKLHCIEPRSYRPDAFDGEPVRLSERTHVYYTFPMCNDLGDVIGWRASITKPTGDLA